MHFINNLMLKIKKKCISSWLSNNDNDNAIDKII